MQKFDISPKICRLGKTMASHELPQFIYSDGICKIATFDSGIIGVTSILMVIIISSAGV